MRSHSLASHASSDHISRGGSIGPNLFIGTNKAAIGININQHNSNFNLPINNNLRIGGSFELGTLQPNNNLTQLGIQGPGSPRIISPSMNEECAAEAINEAL